MLVSQGAHTFATLNGVPTCDLTALVAPRCVEEWEHWKKILNYPPHPTQKQGQDAEMAMQDTVGAISRDSNGELAAGVSRFVLVLVRSRTHSVHSGGLLLKHPGRIGEVRNRYVNPRWPVTITYTRPQRSVLGAGHTRIPESVSLAVCQVRYAIRHSNGPLLMDCRNRRTDYMRCDGTDSGRTAD